MTFAASDASSNPEFVRQTLAAAMDQTGRPVRYDGAYRRIPYPGGDVPADDRRLHGRRRRGRSARPGSTCSGEVHEDMRQQPCRPIPGRGDLAGPDTNIDHRRVPNLQAYFRRRGVALPVTRDMRDYVPGDVVTWMLPGNLPHIGLVTERRSADGERPLLVHNIGRGPELEDMIFGFPITGHYRYRGE